MQHKEQSRRPQFGIFRDTWWSWCRISARGSCSPDYSEHLTYECHSKVVLESASRKSLDDFDQPLPNKQLSVVQTGHVLFIPVLREHTHEAQRLKPLQLCQYQWGLFSVHKLCVSDAQQVTADQLRTALCFESYYNAADPGDCIVISPGTSVEEVSKDVIVDTFDPAGLQLGVDTGISSPFQRSLPVSVTYPDSIVCECCWLTWQRKITTN